MHEELSVTSVVHHHQLALAVMIAVVEVEVVVVILEVEEVEDMRADKEGEAIIMILAMSEVEMVMMEATVGIRLMVVVKEGMKAVMVDMLLEICHHLMEVLVTCNLKILMVVIKIMLLVQFLHRQATMEAQPHTHHPMVPLVVMVVVLLGRTAEVDGVVQPVDMVELRKTLGDMMVVFQLMPPKR